MGSVAVSALAQAGGALREASFSIAGRAPAVGSVPTSREAASKPAGTWRTSSGASLRIWPAAAGTSTIPRGGRTKVSAPRDASAGREPRLLRTSLAASGATGSIHRAGASPAAAHVGLSWKIKAANTKTDPFFLAIRRLLSSRRGPSHPGEAGPVHAFGARDPFPTTG